MRLDIAIVQQYWYSRNKAQAIIRDGLVTISNRIVTKSSYDISESDIINISSSPILEWVSRSAGKLEWFFAELWVSSLSSKIALDIGSSTGGFTQILLAHDIRIVDAVDVGTLQLHETLRRDSRVTSHENTDIRVFFPDKIYDIITIDVSFVSLREIVPVLSRFADDHTNIYMLYKPQFEVWKENLRKTGVPKDDTVIQKRLSEFMDFLRISWYEMRKISKSRVIGEAGNQEYMMHIVRNN
jgi:23S rRNA (cytidine1920-2'-O)/16S rRNA (cytidine1409-2'-O)-methyltransferase